MQIKKYGNIVSSNLNASYLTNFLGRICRHEYQMVPAQSFCLLILIGIINKELIDLNFSCK